jgi:hypothetical protein
MTDFIIDSAMDTIVKRPAPGAADGTSPDQGVPETSDAKTGATQH